MSTVTRETRETRVSVRVERGTGTASVATGVPFLDHMLVTLARTSGLDLDVEARGDLKHHLIEDVAIALGAAVAALGPPTMARYGEKTLAMDDALVQAVIDVGGRPYYRGPLPSSLYRHWMRSFAFEAKATLHVRVLRGEDRHHIVEAAFKALGFALRQALAESGAPASTKGAVSLEVER
ncbi:MAG: imidazoleglycerol-phosphate dehydratase [Candidatus Eisenbacteria bacterium]|nr:imidazoleglycerol-phosphate dehydratase [Candidatus Eisenbacteria bacterium]